MKKLLLTILGIITVPTVVFGVTAFNSAQVGSNPQNGYVLQTNGFISTWVPFSGGGGISTSTNPLMATYFVATGTPASSFNDLTVNGTLTLNGILNATIINLNGTEAALSGVIASSSQIAYATDSKYVYMGDGTTAIGSLNALNPLQRSHSGYMYPRTLSDIAVFGATSPISGLGGFDTLQTQRITGTTYSGLGVYDPDLPNNSTNLGTSVGDNAYANQMLGGAGNTLGVLNIQCLEANCTAINATGGPGITDFALDFTGMMHFLSPYGIVNGTSTANFANTPSPLTIFNSINSYNSIDWSGISGSRFKWSMGATLNTNCQTGGTTQNPYNFVIASSTTLCNNQRFVIDGAGHIGISSSTPNAMLSILSASSSVQSALVMVATSTAGTGTTTPFKIDWNGNTTMTYASTTAISAGTVCLTGDTCRTTWPTGGSSAAADWNQQTNFNALALTPTTTIPVWIKGNFYASSTSLFSSTVAMGATSSPFAGDVLTIYGTTMNGGRLTRFGNGGGNFLNKFNDNSIATFTNVENTQISSADFGTGYGFNLGYGGSQLIYGTSVPAGLIAVASEQGWSSTASTQDAYMKFSTALDGVVGEKMRITSAGNVGIGTSSPLTLFHAAGANTPKFLFDGTNSSFISLNPATASNNSSLYFDSRGNFTIEPQAYGNRGTNVGASPIITIGGSGNNPVIIDPVGTGDVQVKNTAGSAFVVGASYNGLTEIGHTGSGAGYMLAATTDGNNPNPGLGFKIAADGRSVAVNKITTNTATAAITDVSTMMTFITSANPGAKGAFGIGTTTPIWLLEVASTTANSGFMPQFALTDSGAAAGQKHITFANEGGNLYIAPASDVGATSTPLITALSSGNIGLGTANPAVMLDVLGAHTSGIGLARFKSTSGTAQLTLDTTGSGDRAIRFLSNGSNGGGIGAFNATGNVAITNIGLTGELFSVNMTSGNVGVGTTSPWRTFSSQGTASFSGLNWGIGSTTCITSNNEFVTCDGAVNISDVTITNTTASSTVFTGANWVNRTYPANSLTAGKQICVDIRGVYTAPVASNVILRMVMGTGTATTTLAQIQTSALANVSGQGFDGTGCFTIRSTGTSGTVRADGNVAYSIGSGLSPIIDFMKGSGTVNTTVAQTLDVTATWDSANSNRSVTITQASAKP